MEIIPLCYGGTEVRVILDENGEPWFVAKDVCTVLEYSDTEVALRKLDDDEKLIQKVFVSGDVANADTLNRKSYGSGQERDMWTINEPGLYTLILRSNKPEAKVFKRWVTHDVLPSIRKTGSYSMSDNHAIDDRDQIAFYRVYETINPNSEFIVEFQGVRVNAYSDVNHGFLITTGELARIMGVAASTLRVLKKYHRKSIKAGIHYVELGQRELWTRKGAGWIGLHNRDGSFGRYLLDGGMDKQLESHAELLSLDGKELVARFEAMRGVA